MITRTNVIPKRLGSRNSEGEDQYSIGTTNVYRVIDLIDKLVDLIYKLMDLISTLIDMISKLIGLI